MPPMRNKHPATLPIHNQVTRLLGEDDSGYYCKTCGKRSSGDAQGRKTMSMHVRSHIIQQVPPQEVDNYIVTKNGTHYCTMEDCSQSYATKQGARKHLRTSHHKFLLAQWTDKVHFLNEWEQARNDYHQSPEDEEEQYEASCETENDNNSQSSSQSSDDDSDDPDSDDPTSEEFSGPSTTNPISLFKILMPAIGAARRDMDLILRLLKLGIDWSGIPNVDFIFSQSNEPKRQRKTRCETCKSDIDLKRGTCESNECRLQKSMSFSYASLRQQIVNTVSGEFLHSWSRDSYRVSDEICDIYDGEPYHQAQIEFRRSLGLQNEVTVLNLILCTDGVAKGVSSKDSFYPVFLTIQELCPDSRFRQNKILTASIWCGRGVPNFDFLFEELNADIDQINTVDPVYIMHSENPKRVFVNLLGITSDLIAKAKLMNIKSATGFNACSLCTIEGVSYDKGAGSARSYHETPSNVAAITRTDANIRQDSAAKVNGFLGEPRVMKLRPRDLGNFFFLDEMHCWCLGVMKKLMELWFLTTTQAEYKVTDQNKARVTARLLGCRGPAKLLPRATRALDIKKCKANEFRTFLSHYGKFAMESSGLPRKFLDHFDVLILAYRTLNNARISLTDIAKADSLLVQFVTRFPDLYGDNSVSLNVHSLVHMADMVRNWDQFGSTACSRLSLKTAG